MQIKCSNCGEMNEKGAKFCASCDQKIDLAQVIRELRLDQHQTYSRISLILGAIGIGLLIWLPTLFLNVLEGKIAAYLSFAIVCFSLIIAIIGLIFGGKGAKPIMYAKSMGKGKKAQLIIGILFNLIHLACQIYCFEMIFINFL